MKYINSRFQRRSMVFTGIPSIFSTKVKAAKNFPVAPCSFPFDAGHKGTLLNEKFNIKTHRNYIFTLEFHHNGGSGAVNLSKLLNAEYGLFVASSINSDHPIRVTDEYFMEKKEFFSAQERGVAITEAHQKYNKALRTAIDFENKNVDFMWLPQNLKALIPILISITKIELNGDRIIIFDESIDTLGTFVGGDGRFDRKITVEELRPGTYELHAETIRDSPLFFDIPINLGITYHSKTVILK